MKYLEDICSLISLKGKLKAKKLAGLMEAVDPRKDLGPYGGGSYKSPRGGAAVPLAHVGFHELQGQCCQDFWQKCFFFGQIIEKIRLTTNNFGCTFLLKFLCYLKIHAKK
jgi:hypothetical protein